MSEQEKVVSREELRTADEWLTVLPHWRAYRAHGFGWELALRMAFIEAQISCGKALTWPPPSGPQ